MLQIQILDIAASTTSKIRSIPKSNYFHLNDGLSPESPCRGLVKWVYELDPTISKIYPPADVDLDGISGAP